MKFSTFSLSLRLVMYHLFLSSVHPTINSLVRSFAFVCSLAYPPVRSFLHVNAIRRAFKDVFSPSKYSAIFMSKVHQCISAAIISLDKERIDTQSIVV